MDSGITYSRHPCRYNYRDNDIMKFRRPPKDKKTGLPKKYLSGTKGKQRARLASITKRMAKLAREGKPIPQSLIAERLRLGS